MSKNELESTNRLLKVVVSLLIKRRELDPLTLREQIAILNNLGLKPIEIAEILGRSGTYVNKELSGIRKNKN